ncbi:MAG: translational GTPase TypA [Chloroflexi bacterium]|nr:translational GTPase TypA [Chloroflexota bacterium]
MALDHARIRNVAIIAHVDHGKTSLVDAMLKFTRVFREGQVVGTLILDSDPLERERGITILAKNTAIRYEGVKINIIDTPGHVDFSGEVERIVNMADGCLLVVDGIDGPMPQTRSVLRTALAHGLKPVVVINKIDRPATQIAEVESAVQDLFLSLATDADQLDFPVLYASARDGYALAHPGDEHVDMTPLFEAIVRDIPAPRADPDAPFQMLVATQEYDNHLGLLAIGRVFAGRLKAGSQVVRLGADGLAVSYKASSLFTFENLQRVPMPEATAGDIVAVAGISEVAIGDTITVADGPGALPRIAIEEPTVKMTFGVNTSPFAGREGQYATSRMLWARLQRELQTNVAMRAETTDSAEEFLVSGRGELHLAVLIEHIRREGLEIQVSRPEAITRTIDGRVHEPYERLTIETPAEFIGALSEELASRLAKATNYHTADDGYVHQEYEIPTRGLIGFNSFFQRSTRGHGVMNSAFLGMRPVRGEVRNTRPGAMVASAPGTATSYSLLNAQERGTTFVEPGTPVYEGMVFGLTNREGDLQMNVAKERKQTNVRSSTSEITQKLAPAFKPTLDESLGLIAADELLEVTPQSLRLRKRALSGGARYRQARGAKRSA